MIGAARLRGNSAVIVAAGATLLMVMSSVRMAERSARTSPMSWMDALVGYRDRRQKKKSTYSKLGSAVYRQRLLRCIGSRTGRDDNTTRAFAVPEVAQRQLGEIQDSTQVDVQHAIPRLQQFIVIIERVGKVVGLFGHPRIRHRDVDVAGVLKRLF